LRPIVVTGAAGFAGRHLVARLVALGRPVEAWVHRPPPEGTLRCPARIIDIRDAAACARALAARPPAGLVHLAAVTSVGDAERDPEQAQAVNVRGTRNVLAPLAAGTPAVLASTCHVYGVPRGLPLTEDTPLAPVGAYARTKAEAEAAARSAHPAVVTARAFHHTGPGQSPRFALAQWARDLAQGVSPIRTGDLSLRRDYSDVRDIAGGYLHLLDHAPGGTVVNLCSGVAPSLGELLQTMAGRGGARTLANPAWFRDHDPAEIRGCPARASALGWTTTTPMAQTLADLRGSFPKG
jgi:GDP-4-dehydro-6-deoxy-D-mannose reductase